MNRLVIFSLIMVFFACTPKIQEASTIDFDKANSLKSETAELQLSIKDALQDLLNQRNNIRVQGRALTDGELKYIDNVEEIMADQEKLEAFQDDIIKSEGAYEPNGKELLYLNEQANKLVKKIQKKVLKLTKTK